MANSSPPQTLLGQVCIGRVTGALSTPTTHTRGCDWTANGLFHGPWEVLLSNGRTVGAFPLAPATDDQPPRPATTSRSTNPTTERSTT